MDNFSGLLGQERAKKIMVRSLKTDRVSHAYLLLGPAGTGKRSLAMTFAAALNCDADGPPCGSCASCRRIAKGNHPDIVVLEPEGKRFKIEQIRRLQKQIALKPYEGKYKVFVLDGVEAFTDQAANALLKTLEEPPAHSVLILLANDSLLLPTITSRCTIIHLQPLPQETVAQELIGRGVADADEIAKASRGSVGKALRLAEIWNELMEQVRSMINWVENDRAYQLEQNLYARFKEDEEFRELFLDLLEEQYLEPGRIHTEYKALDEIRLAREMLKSNVGPDTVLRSLAIRLARLQRRAV